MSSEIIEEQGIVKAIAKGIATVEIQRPYCKTEGGKCAMCSFDGSGRMTIEVETDMDLKVGQEVTLQIEQAPILGALFFVFILPLVCLLVGIIVGDAVFGRMGVLLGVAMCVASFSLAFLYDRHLRATKRAAVRILPESRQQ